MFDFIFRQYADVQLRILDDVFEFYSAEADLKISYGGSESKDALKISPSSYFKNQEWAAAPELEKDLEYADGRFSFDFVAAIFFLLSRAEEYSDTDRDVHHRFQAKNSVLSQRDF